MRKNRAGFASVTAIVLMGLISMTLTAMCVTLVSDARRTMVFEQDAQLRQLLLVGAAVARGRLETNPPDGTVAVMLPDALHGQRAALTIEFRAGKSQDERIVQIDASLPQRRMSQEIHFARLGNGWQMTSAAISS